MAYTNEELSRIVDNLRVRLDQGVDGPPADLMAPQNDAVGEYSGPGYPRITAVRPGVRRVQLDRERVFLVEELNAPQLKQGLNPGVYPSVVDISATQREIHYSPGAVFRVKSHEMDSDTGRPLDDFRANAITRHLRILDQDQDLQQIPFSGHAAFYFHPDDAHLPVTERRAAQGPVPGDPDYGVTAVNEGGYETGTQANPYRPWEDPDSPFYGWPVNNS